MLPQSDADGADHQEYNFYLSNCRSRVGVMESGVCAKCRDDLIRL